MVSRQRLRRRPLHLPQRCAQNSRFWQKNLRFPCISFRYGGASRFYFWNDAVPPTCLGVFAFRFSMRFRTFFVWVMLVVARAGGGLNPFMYEICGSSSFDAEVCGTSRYCVNNARFGCPLPDVQTWDDISGKCFDGKEGSCTAHSCDSLPGSICVPKQSRFVEYHSCVKSSSSIVTAPAATALASTVFIAIMS